MEIMDFRQVVQSCLSGKATTLRMRIEKVELNRAESEKSGIDTSLNCIITTFEGVDDQDAVKTRHRMLSMTTVSEQDIRVISDEHDNGRTKYLVVKADTAQLGDTDRVTRRKRIETIMSGRHVQLIEKSCGLQVIDHILKPMDRGLFRLFLAHKNPIVMRFPLGNNHSKIHFAIAPIIDKDESGN
jgi:hypothetical protein